MLESINVLGKQIREIWHQFGAAQRFNAIMSLLVVVGVIAALLHWSARPDYRLLYSNLSLEDASAMREKLDEAEITVKLGQSGMSLSVPAADLYRARLMLASSGLPNDNSTGFELFEQPKFGLTDFAQRVNYQRALQGELERTISSMQGIRSARVMLVLPKERLFASVDERSAQASIMLTLKGSVAMGDAQVQSIVHIVAGSVQSLDPSNVTVSDQNGHLLTRASSGENSIENSNEQLALQERTETRLAEKAQAMLDRALGAGNSIVRVSVTMDFSDIEQRSEVYDAENRVVKSEHITSEDESGGSSGAGGAAGLVANVPVGDPSAMKMAGNPKQTKKQDISTEYVVPMDVRMVRQTGARLQNMTVAVCLAKGSEARSDEEMQALQELVSNAVGLQASGTDTIHVTEMTFASAPEPPAAKWWEELPVSYDALFKGAGGLMALGLIFGVSRRVMNTMLASNPALEFPFNDVNEKVQEQVRHEDPMALEDQLEALSRLARSNTKTVAAWINAVDDWES